MDIRSTLIDAVCLVCGTRPDEVLDERALLELGVDSLDFIEVAMIVEDKFGVRIDPDLFADVSTFGDALAVFNRVLTGVGE